MPHEAADLIPSMTPEEFDALKSDIAANGQLEPILLLDNKIIDGRHRYRACRELGIEPETRAWERDGRSVVNTVVSLNVHRRHLTASQKAVLAVDLLPWYEAEAKLRQGTRTDIRAIVPECSGKATEVAGQSVGVAPRYVSEAKRLSVQAPELFGQVREGVLTLPEAKREARRATNETRNSLLKPGAFPEGKYGVIYADPPWQYDFNVDSADDVENHYPTMPLEAICALDVENLAADDCVLMLWATSPKLLEALAVMEAWGFSYRTNMVWVKNSIGPGYYARARHELLLIGKRGNPPIPEPSNRPDSVLESPRGKHSAKPPEYYQIIESMYPGVPKVELFCRTPQLGWAVWGNEADE